jgi:hypothetical protein
MRQWAGVGIPYPLYSRATQSDRVGDCMKLTRNQFLRTIGFASAAVVSGDAVGSAVTADSNAGRQASSGNQKEATARNIMLGVSLYSYQHAFYTGEMTLEDSLAELSSIGARGVQIIDEITVPNFPNPSEQWVDHWFEMCDKHKLTPTNMDAFVDVYWGWRHKPMDLQEQVETLATRLKLARRLGFKVVRPTSGSVSEPVGQLFEKIVPIAEALDVKVTPELHAPIPLQSNGAFVGGILEIIHKTGTKHLGFTLDIGDLPLPFSKERSIKYGELSEEIATYIDKAKAGGVAVEEVQAKVKSMNPKPGDLGYINRVYGIRPMGGAIGAAPAGGSGAPPGPPPGGMGGMMMNVQNDPKDVTPLIPYIYNVHGKFYRMTEDLVETTLDYEGAFKALVEGGYQGSIDSEYEGQRLLQNQWCEPVNEVEQVRRHHLMMRRLLGRA